MKIRNLLLFVVTMFTSLAVSAQTLVSTNPADGTAMDTFSGVTLSFDSSVTPFRSWSTDVALRVGSATGSKVSVAEWTLEKVGTDGVKIYPVNNAGTLSPIALEGGKEYYLVIPAGHIKEYAQEIVLRYTGPESAAALSITGMTPADGASVETFSGVTIDFSEAVTTRSSWSTKITLTTGSASGTKVSVAEWELEKAGANSVKIYPGNSSGSLSPVDMEEGTDYYLTIPAGEIKEWAEPIVIHYAGAKAVKPALSITGMTPADGASVETFSGVTIDFSEAVTTRSSWSTKIALTTGSASGTKVSVAEWELEKAGANSVKIYPGNSSGSLSPVDMEEGTDYYLTIPAGEIKEWAEPIVIHYAGAKAAAPALAIESALPANESELTVFDGVTLKFNAAVTPSRSWSTDVTLRAGSPSGTKISVAEWTIEKVGTDGVKIYPVNNAGTLTPITLEAGTEYYLTIPKGTVKEWAEPIELHYICPAAPVAEHEIMLYGTLLYSGNWTKGQARVGMYRIPVSGEGGFEPVALDSRLSAQMGGTLVGDRYFASFANDIGLTTLWVNTLWDTNTWEPIEIIPNGDQNTMASCLTTDNTTGTVYGCFADGTFGTINPTTKVRTSIADVAEAWNALACGPDGAIWAIDMAGNLLSIDKSTGAATTIGSTGLTPQYMTSAAIDPISGRMFYALHTDASCGLYEISLTDGSATLMFAMPGNEWFAGMYIPGAEAEAGAPEAATAIAAQFNGADLSGKISFKAPETTYGGAKLTGSLTYTIANGSTILASGNCTPGTDVTADVTLAEAGMARIIVTLSNEVGKSPKAIINRWIGADTPLAPASVTLSENTDGGYLVQWTAPGTTGVNGGAVDPSALTYTVTRFPDEAIVAEGITATSFVDRTNTITGTSFHYAVTATYMGNTSAAAVSAEMKFGVIMPPYEASFDDQASFDLFTVINANNDSERWSWNSSKKAARLSATSARDMDDWLVTPAIELEKGMVYAFSIDAASQSASYPESVEVMLGSAPEAAALTTTVVERAKVPTTTFTTYEGKIKVTESGIYYIGVHGCSERDTYSIYVDNIRLSAGEEGEYSNLAIEALRAPRYVEAGNNFTATVAIANPGTTASDGAMVEIYAGDACIAAKAIETAAGSHAAVDFELTAERTWDASTALSARIAWDADEDTNDNTSATVSMTVHVPVLPAVGNVTATPAEGVVTLNWSAPDLSDTEGVRVTDNFESYTPFDYASAGHWTMVDGDDAPTFGFSNEKIGFPGMGNPAGFFTFDASYRVEYNSQTALEAHSGNMYMASFASMGGVTTDNWLISPRLSGAAQAVSLYAKSFDPAYGETFEILASAKDMEASDFTVVKTCRNIKTTWTEYTADLPEGTIFFAVRHVSTDSYMMMIDDATFTSAGTIDFDLQLAGYNVYCDGVKVNDAPVAEPTFSHDASGVYTVEAVYNKGVSEMSDGVSATLSGIDTIDTDNASAPVEYYNVHGQRISNPTPGTVVIRRQGSTVTKLIAK